MLHFGLGLSQSWMNGACKIRHSTMGAGRGICSTYSLACFEPVPPDIHNEIF